MKRTLFFIALVLSCATTIFAQNDKISYQAVVRDAENRLVANKTVDVTVNIFNGNDVTAVYAETHTVTTNQNGVISLLIGNGTPLSGASWSDIQWKNARLTTAVILNGEPLGTLDMPLTAVPYARYADYADSVNLTVIQNYTENTISDYFNQLVSDGHSITVSVQSDWAQADESATNYIKNKPNLDQYAKKDTLNYYYTKAQSDAKYLTSFVEIDPNVPAWAKAATKPVYNYSEIQNTPTIPTVPTNVSAFQNDAGYLTNYTETDPTVYPWAKAATKPVYDYSEIQNTPTIPTVPTNVSAFQNDAGYLTNYTETDPTVYPWAKAATKPVYDYSEIQNTPTIPTVPTNVSAFQNDAGYLTNYTETDPTVYPWAKAATKPVYNYSEIQNTPTIPAAQVNSDWNATSGVEQILNKPTALSAFTNDLGYVTSFEVMEAANIPTNVSAFQNDAGYITTETDPTVSAWAKAATKPAYDYSEIQNTPTIPTVNNATLTIKQGENTLGTFTANAGTDATINVPVPATQVNADWDATSGTAEILNKPTNVSAFTNDAGYITQAYFDQYMDSLSQAYQDKIDSLGALLEDVKVYFSSTPTVVTDRVTDIGMYTATFKGHIQTNGGSEIIRCGFCYGLNPNLDISTGEVIYIEVDENETLEFSADLTVLAKDTVYYVRALAVNVKGTSYGNIVNFKTLDDESTVLSACPNATTVMDVEGNVYKTVLIGEQCWMRENLRVTRFNNSITDSTVLLAASNTYNDAVPYRYYPNGNADLVPTYGYLYNWAAATYPEGSSANPSGVQGICPKGWHLPSSAEWDELLTYVKTQSNYICITNPSNPNPDYIASALASTTGWQTQTGACYVGTDATNNNATGFSAVPAGNHESTSYTEFGTGANFWSSSFNAANTGTGYRMGHNSATVTKNNERRYYGKSVRCVKDVDDSEAMSAILPVVTTDAIYNITSTSATVDANVTELHGSDVTEKGICWGTEPYPTIAGHHTPNGSGLGSFTTTISGLNSLDAVYYVRAYATNSNGTSYGRTMTITIFDHTKGQVCSSTPTVTDYDGNVYNTVQIGDQCWTRENMRTTHYANGDVIEYKKDKSGAYNAPYCYAPAQKEFNIPIYGYLYNWYAATKGDTTRINVQGLYPNGWHLPNQQEWEQLIAYTQTTTNCQCNTNTTYVTKALSSTMGWKSDTKVCTPGNAGNSTDFINVTGFSALPAGLFYYSDGYKYGYITQRACFWSATQYSEKNARSDVMIYYNNATVQTKSNYYKVNGLSVRCIRN